MVVGKSVRVKYLPYLRVLSCWGVMEGSFGSSPELFQLSYSDSIDIQGNSEVCQIIWAKACGTNVLIGH